jgi:hypothetical protein
MKIHKRAFSSTMKTSNLLDLVQEYVSVPSTTQRLKLLTQFAFGALRDPMRADYVAAVGDLTSVHALRDIRRRMM